MRTKHSLSSQIVAVSRPPFTTPKLQSTADLSPPAAHSPAFNNQPSTQPVVLHSPHSSSAASFRISRRRPTKARSDTATSSSGSEPSTLLDVRHSSKDYRAN
nr:hypothetical protein Iba_chr12aCG21000 [Ipomoea batatas]